MGILCLDQEIPPRQTIFWLISNLNADLKDLYKRLKHSRALKSYSMDPSEDSQTKPISDSLAEEYQSDREAETFLHKQEAETTDQEAESSDSHIQSGQDGTESSNSDGQSFQEAKTSGDDQSSSDNQSSSDSWFNSAGSSPLESPLSCSSPLDFSSESPTSETSSSSESSSPRSNRSKYLLRSGPRILGNGPMGLRRSDKVLRS